MHLCGYSRLVSLGVARESAKLSDRVLLSYVLPKIAHAGDARHFDVRWTCLEEPETLQVKQQARTVNVAPLTYKAGRRRTRIAGLPRSQLVAAERAKSVEGFHLGSAIRAEAQRRRLLAGRLRRLWARALLDQQFLRGLCTGVHATIIWVRGVSLGGVALCGRTRAGRGMIRNLPLERRHRLRALPRKTAGF